MYNQIGMHSRTSYHLMLRLLSRLPTMQWWKQDQNVKTKTKTKSIRPRPRPIKQQQDYITKKLFCCNMHVCYQKITLCKKRQKVIWWSVTFGTVSALIARKKYMCLLHFSIIMSHSACRAQQCFSKTKSIRPRPRPRPVWDQSCHKTAVSDPKTGIFRQQLKRKPISFSAISRLLSGH